MPRPVGQCAMCEVVPKICSCLVDQEHLEIEQLIFAKDRRRLVASEQPIQVVLILRTLARICCCEVTTIEEDFPYSVLELREEERSGDVMIPACSGSKAL